MRIQQIEDELKRPLEELRVAIPGVQLLFAFLLMVPFNQRYTAVGQRGLVLFTAALVSIFVASLLLIAPSVYHRIHFHRDINDKQQMLGVFNRLAICGSAFLAGGLILSLSFLCDFLFGIVGAVVSVLASSVLAVSIWYVLPLRRRCVVEAPRGSAVKFKYDPALKAFVMGHEPFKGLTYPFDWVFLPSTIGEDGDPLDVMIFHDSASFSGVVVPAQVIGVLETKQTDKDKRAVRNDRFLAVPVSSHREDELKHVDQLSKRMRQELERFFLATSELEDKTVEILGWRGAKVAKGLIEEGARRYRKQE